MHVNTPQTRKKRRLWIIGTANVLALPIYGVEILHLAQYTAPFFVAVMASIILGALVSFAITWMWARDARLGAAAQLAAFSPMIFYGMNRYRLVSGRGLDFGDFLDVRIAAGIFAAVVVPGLLIGFALVLLRRPAARREGVENDMPDDQWKR